MGTSHETSALAARQIARRKSCEMGRDDCHQSSASVLRRIGFADVWGQPSQCVTLETPGIRTNHRLLGICFFNPAAPSPRIAPGWRGCNRASTAFCRTANDRKNHEKRWLQSSQSGGKYPSKGFNRMEEDRSLFVFNLQELGAVSPRLISSIWVLRVQKS